LGRNAEGLGSVNTSGRLAAMYSYSKTKGLFGGVSVEGTVIVSRPDANRLAYGGKPTVKQILSGAFDWPPWAGGLIQEIENCTSVPAGAGGVGSQPWVEDEEGEGVGMGSGSATGMDRKGYGNRDYVFGEGLGGGGSAPANGRKRAGSLFGSGAKGEKGGKETDKAVSRPNEPRRHSSLNPFSSASSSSRRETLPSSESYNAGLTADSSGPMTGYGTRPRGASNPPRPTNGNGSSKFAVPFASDFDDDCANGSSREKLRGSRENGTVGRDDLLDTGTNGLSTSFSRLSTSGKANGARSRSNSKPTPFRDIIEDDDPRSIFSNGDRTSPNKLSKGRINITAPQGPTSPFEEDDVFRSPFESGLNTPNSRASGSPKPHIPLKAGLDSAKDGHARAIAQFDFNATDPGDLGFKSGQVVIVLDKVGKGDWWKGRGTDGKEGIFPSNYVEVVDIPDKIVGGIGRGDLKARMIRVEFD